MNILHIASREFKSYFNSLLGYVGLTLMLGITGVFFWLLLSSYATYSEQAAANPMMGDMPSLTEVVVGNLFSNMAVILLFFIPMLTMRLIAEERRHRTFELLMTAPVSSAEIVIGKFLGSLAYLGVALLLTIHYPILLVKLGTPDIGVLSTAYAGTFLFGAACLAFGLLTSSFTQHQLVAAATTFVGSLLFWVIGWAAGEGSSAAFFKYLSFSEHFDGFIKGFVKLESVVFFASCVVLFLFATLQRVETMRRE